LTEHCYEFTSAITRLPAASIVRGLRAEDVGDPDYEQMLRDHAHYVATLKEAGARVTELSALQAFPDAVFVEDVALCLPEAAILMRPGAASRRGEVGEMESTLRDVYD
jgi:dimethylargininase